MKKITQQVVSVGCFFAIGLGAAEIITSTPAPIFAQNYSEANRLMDRGLQQMASFREYPEAIESYQKALQLYRAEGNRKGEAEALESIGHAYSRQLQYQKAIDFFQQTAAIRKQIGDIDREADTLRNLGSAYYSLGQNQKGKDFMEKSIVLKMQYKERFLRRFK